MTDSYWRIILALVFTCVPPVSGCANSESGWTESSIPQYVAEAIHGDRVLANPRGRTGHLRPVLDLTLPDSLSGFYRLSTPVDIALSGPPNCWVAIADVVDQAIHVFSVNGEYRTSFFGGHRDAPLFGRFGLRAIYITEDDKFLAATMGGQIITFDIDGHVLSVTELEEPPRRAAVVVPADGLYYEHWLAGVETVVRGAQWSEDTGLVRVWDGSGRKVRTIGEVAMFPGEGLTHYLNRGFIWIRDGKLWLLRRADARLLAYDLTHGGADPSQVVDLPVYYRADAPREYVNRALGDVAVYVQEHVRDAHMAPNGDIFVLQATSWPAPTNEAPSRPVTVLAVISQDGTPRGIFRSDGMRSVAVSGDYVAGVIDAAPGAPLVRLYANPTGYAREGLTAGCGVAGQSR